MKRGIVFTSFLILIIISNISYAENCAPITENPDGSCDFESATGDKMADYCDSGSCTASQIGTLSTTEQQKFWSKSTMVSTYSAYINPTNTKYLDTSDSEIIRALIPKREDLLKVPGAFEDEQLKDIAMSDSMSQVDMSDKATWDAFDAALTNKEKFDFAKEHLGTEQLHDISINFFKSLFQYSMQDTDDEGNPIPDLDLTNIPDATITEMLNQLEGYDISITYPEGTSVQIIDGALIIGGNVINIESMKGAKHTIILAGGKVLVDGIDAYGAKISADSEIIIFEEGAFSFHDIED